MAVLCAEDGTLTGGLFPPGFTDFADAKVSAGLPSEHLSGPQSIVPDGRKQYVENTLELLKL